jgi:hypothetical protein
MILKLLKDIWLLVTGYIVRSLQAIRAEQASQRLLLEKILAAVTPLPAVSLIFTVELEGQLIHGDKIKVTNSQQATATITPVDKFNNPAPVDGVPVWASSDETIVTVTPADDGLSALVKAVGPLGSANVSVTADADMGAGVVTIFGTLSVDVTPGQAVGITITLGPASEQ